MSVPHADTGETPAQTVAVEAAHTQAWTPPRAHPDPTEPSAPSPAMARSRATAVLAILASIFALHWAQEFFIPLLLGMALAFALNPIVLWMERIKIPRLIGTSLVMLTLVGVGTMGMLSLRGEAERIMDQVPEAAAKLSAAIRTLAAQPNTMRKVQEAAREIEQATTEAADGAPPAPPAQATRVVVEHRRLTLTDVLWTGSLGVFGLIAETVILLLLVFFLLLSGDTFKRKLLHISGPSLSKKKVTVSILDDIHRSIQRYMLAMSLANVLLAVLTWMAFSWIGLDNAGAWGVAAGVLHFIPYVGPAFIAVATGMAAFMQFESFAMVLLVSGSSLLLATLVGMVIITWMSCRIGRMNASAVFVSLLFWGWLWGAMGLLLAIPIMGTVRVVSAHIEELHPLAELLDE